MDADKFAAIKALLTAILTTGCNAAGMDGVAAVEKATDQADMILEQCGIAHPDWAVAS